MSSNVENDRTVTAGKMYPIDLAPQKITIVKSVPNSEMKMAHLISGQAKNSATGQLISHTGPMSLMRPAAQIISSGVSTQTQMIVSGSPLLQSAQIVTQGSQIIGQGSQIITPSQIISSGSQLLSPQTQIISQGSQLTSQVSSAGTVNVGTATQPISAVTTVSGGTQVLNVGGQLMGPTSGLVVSSSVRTLPPSVRVLPPLPHHNTRPVLSNVGLGGGGGGVGASVVVNKSVMSHVPRGPAAGASLAVPRVAARPITPVSASLPISTLGAAGAWSSGPRGNVRGALVYSARAAVPRAMQPRVAAPAQAPAASPATPQHPSLITLPATTVLTSSSVISPGVRGASPRALTPTPAQPAPLSQRPIPLLQRNYHAAKVVGVGGAGVRNPVGNSAPSQLYYEVPRPPAPHSAPPAPRAPSPAPPQPAPANRALPTYNHQAANSHMMTSSAVQVMSEARLPLAPSPAPMPVSLLSRPSILRKREIDGSPAKMAGVGAPAQYDPAPLAAREVPSPSGPPSPSPWERDGPHRDGSGSGGSTTMSAASSPAPEDDPLSPPRPATPQDISPRKKPRKQILTSEVRHCDFPAEEPPPTPPPAPAPPKRPLLSSSFVCGWRATALHFTRPSDVRRREPRARDIVALANQPHALTNANGWKVHHLTAQMDDLVSLESDVGSQLSNVLRALETAHSKAQAALAPHSHALLELIKGNMQRSKIVCEGIQEAREDILRVFTHQTVVADILTRQADKRCFRKHRSQS